jgi:hypothetical protein
VPKKKRALVVNGQPVASVDTPRHYHGKHFMTDAVASRADRIAGAVLRHIMRVFDPLEHRP